MDIIEENDNVLNVYNLQYDEEKVEDLMAIIARDCSFKLYGEYWTDEKGERIEAVNSVEAINIITNMRNSAGYNVFRKLDESSIRLKDYDGWERGPLEVHFEAQKTILPYLYCCLELILKGFEDGYYKLLSYWDTSEYIPFDVREKAYAERLKSVINDADLLSIDIDEVKAYALQIEEIRRWRNNNPDYNFELLEQYYKEALSLFTLKLVSRTEFYTDGEVMEIKAKGTLRRKM